MHIEFMQNYIKLCDFTKHGFSKNANKKKTQESVISEVISKYRSNIMHYLPFFKINDKDKGYIPLVIGGTSVLDLSTHLTKVLAVSETNYSLDANQMYILGVNQENKAVLLQISHQFKDNNLATEVTGSAELASLDTSKSYKVLTKDKKVAIVESTNVLVLNSHKLEEQHSATAADSTVEAAGKFIMKLSLISCVI